MNILLDTNIVLDLMLERDPWRAEAGDDGRLQSHVCASAITDIFYISRKFVGADKPRRVVRKCLDALQVVSVTRDLLDIAERSDGIDFEDNLQIACAVESKLDAIVTRNPKDFVGSPVVVLTPAELLALLAKAPDA